MRLVVSRKNGWSDSLPGGQGMRLHGMKRGSITHMLLIMG